MGESAEALAAMEDAARCFLRAGTLDRALAVAGEADRYARAVQQEGATRWALHVAATVALLRADLPRARQLAGRLPAFPRAALEVALAERTGGDAPRGALAPVETSAPAALRLVQLRGLHARAALLAGDEHAARGALSQWHDAVRHAERWGVGDAIGAVGPALAAAGDEQLVRSVAARFAGAAALRTVASGSADEWRGALALRLGLNDEARAHFHAAPAWKCARAVPAGAGPLPAGPGRRGDPGSRALGGAAAPRPRGGGVRPSRRRSLAGCHPGAGEHVRALAGAERDDRTS